MDDVGRAIGHHAMPAAWLGVRHPLVSVVHAEVRGIVEAALSQVPA